MMIEYNGGLFIDGKVRIGGAKFCDGIVERLHELPYML